MYIDCLLDMLELCVKLGTESFCSSLSSGFSQNSLPELNLWIQQGSTRMRWLDRNAVAQLLRR